MINAGLEAFGTMGYAKTNIKTICCLAGLTQRYFYESFDQKEELLSAVHRELTDELERAAIALYEDPKCLPLEALSRTLKMFFQHLQQDPRRARIQLFEVRGVSPKVDRENLAAMHTLAGVVKLFLSRVFPGIHQEALDSSIVSAGLAGSLMQISTEWVLNGFSPPLDDIIAQCLDLFIAVGKHLEGNASPRKK